MERTTWTDERIDDLVASIDRQFERVHGEISELRTEVRDLRRDMFHGFIAMFGSQVAVVALLVVERL